MGVKKFFCVCGMLFNCSFTESIYKSMSYDSEIENPAHDQCSFIVSSGGYYI